MASIAFKAAQREAFAAGESVWFSGDGVIYERFPDGSRIDHERVNPPTRVVPGTRYRMRRVT